MQLISGRKCQPSLFASHHFISTSCILFVSGKGQSAVVPVETAPTNNSPQNVIAIVAPVISAVILAVIVGVALYLRGRAKARRPNA